MSETEIEIRAIPSIHLARVSNSIGNPIDLKTDDELDELDELDLDKIKIN